jgi:predicted ATPase/DNA-binding CsgD family transcriptional regulator
MISHTQPKQPDNDVTAEPLAPVMIGRTRRNLPAMPTPLIGREREVAAAATQLRRPDVRLLTLIGPGGAGKTRLGLQVAEDLLGEFADGVFFVSLTPISDPKLVAAAIAQRLGIRESHGRSLGDLVQDWLREKQVLLLLDNFEQVPVGALFISSLIAEAPALKVIVTSRVRLNVRGEQVFELAGLSCPPNEQVAAEQALNQYGAVQLFVQTAHTLTPAFALSAETAPAIIRICRLIEGLPLGIELAANWTRFLSCAEIAHEIAQNLDFLNTTTQDMPERHQSLRAVFAHSWELLTAAEQQALRRLALFRGSFTREAAAAVAGAPLPLLAALVDRSLVRRVIADGNGAGARYEVHEILRQYAAEELERAGETTATAQRHMAYYATLLEERAADLRGPRQIAALAAIGAEIEQIRAAWRWAVAHADDDAIGRAADSLFHFYDMRSWFQEGAEAFGGATRALAPADPDDTGALAWARALARQGWFTFHLGRQPEAKSMLEQSLSCLRALDARAEMVFALNYLAAVCSYLGEYRLTYALCDESLELTQALDDLYGQGVACNILGQTVYARGEYAVAKAWFERSRALGQEIGNRWSIAFSLTNLGNVDYALGEYAEARQLFEESLRIREETGDLRGVASCFNRLGDTAVALSDYDQAEDRYGRSLAIFREIGNQWGMASSLINLGRLASKHERYGAAARAFQEALRLAIGTQATPQIMAIFSCFADLLRRGGEAAWANELAQFAATEPESVAACLPHAERLLAWQAGDSAIERSVGAQRGAAGPHSPAGRALPAAYPGGLTAREVDVLRLVAQGLTDAQVAEKLIVSRRTVSTHLTSIYSKLHVASRSAATRFAVEQGLV